MMNPILLVLITIFIPPIGVLIIDGCGANLIINIVLTLLGYLPGHIHAFYLEWKAYHDVTYAGGRQGMMNQPGSGAPGTGYGAVN